MEHSLFELRALVNDERLHHLLDYTDPKAWKVSVEVVMNNLHIIAPLAGIVAFAAYWFRGAIEKGAKDGLKEQNEGLMERNNALEERLKLARDSEEMVTAKNGELQLQIQTLSTQVKTVAYSFPDLASISAQIAITASEVRQANTKLAKLLSPSPPIEKSRRLHLSRGIDTMTKP